MARFRTISLILCLSIIVAAFGLFRIDKKTEYNAKIDGEKVQKLSNLRNDKKN